MLNVNVHFWQPCQTLNQLFFCGLMNVYRWDVWNFSLHVYSFLLTFNPTPILKFFSFILRFLVSPCLYYLFLFFFSLYFKISLLHSLVSLANPSDIGSFSSVSQGPWIWCYHLKMVTDVCFLYSLRRMHAEVTPKVWTKSRPSVVHLEKSKVFG